MSEQLSDRQWANILYRDLQLANIEIAQLKEANQAAIDCLEQIHHQGQDAIDYKNEVVAKLRVGL